MSSESAWAWRSARFYGPRVVQKSRVERIEWLRAEIAELEVVRDNKREARKAECECKGGDKFCLCRLWIAPEDQRISYLRELIRDEEADALYAQQAQSRNVDYKQHIDGFCRYWQNVRYRKFVAVECKCERCGNETGLLEAHHTHYDTLGFEELSDLEALCQTCHRASHRRWR